MTSQNVVLCQRCLRLNKKILHNPTLCVGYAKAIQSRIFFIKQHRLCRKPGGVGQHEFPHPPCARMDTELPRMLGGLTLSLQSLLRVSVVAYDEMLCLILWYWLSYSLVLYQGTLDHSIVGDNLDYTDNSHNTNARNTF